MPYALYKNISKGQCPIRFAFSKHKKLLVIVRQPNVWLETI